MEQALVTLQCIAWSHKLHGYITVGELARLSGVSESTARRRIKELLKLGVLMWRNRGQYALDNRDGMARMLQFAWDEEVDGLTEEMPF